MATRLRGFRIPHSAFRTGVTLVELLITVTIIAILSAAFIGVSSVAMEGARAARTKSTITKLHTLLAERWASYMTRRVDVDPVILKSIEDDLRFGNISPKQRGEILADLRLLAVRELMMLEMPDSWSDILLNPVNSNPATTPRVLSAFPALRGSYLRRYDQVIRKTPPNAGDNIDKIVENQGAECLYMIIMLSTGDGEARTLFTQRDIGDTDGDGAPEFLDGWGRPIHFIRWPAGLVARSDLMSGDADADHDPFDAFRRDQLDAQRPSSGAYPVNSVWIDELGDDYSAFRLVPLIYSAGADGETDIDDLPYTGTAPPTSLNPYAIDPSPAGSFFVTSADYYVFGHPFDRNEDGDDNSLDNIHNHLLDNR